MSKEFRPRPQVPEDPKVSDFLDEFIDKLREQLESDFKRWGNTWLTRPKEGQELRTKARYTDYFDIFEQTGTPVPWMKIVGGALICWIREQYPMSVWMASECNYQDCNLPDVMEKPVEDMTTKELIELPSSECGCDDCNLPELEATEE